MLGHRKVLYHKARGSSCSHLASIGDVPSERKEQDLVEAEVGKSL